MPENELDRAASPIQRVGDFIYALARRLLFLKMNAVVVAEAAGIHADTLAVSREMFKRTIQETRKAKEEADPNSPIEQQLLEAFLEGTIASSKLVHQWKEAGAPSESEERREALGKPSSALSSSSNESGSDDQTPSTERTEIKPRRRGRPLGSRTVRRHEPEVSTDQPESA